MNTTIKWVDNMLMLGESASGHALVMDGPETLGGKNLGARPMEMLLIGMGGCALVDVVSILKKMHQQITHCQAKISAKRAKEQPRVFTDIHIKFIIKGISLNSQKVTRAINLSITKYCSASIMLGKTANITHDFNIIG